jgi:hypothetical protein
MIHIDFKAKDDPGNTLNLFDTFIKDIDVSDKEIQKKLNDIGKETADKMIEIIDDNKVRPQSDEPLDLEAHINCELFDGGFGVGDIEDLNENVGYWAAVNFGSSHMVGRRVPSGMFSPGEPAPSSDDFREGRWKPGEELAGAGKKHWSFLVTKPIPAMNYVEKTATWLDNRLDKLL